VMQQISSSLPQTKSLNKLVMLNVSHRILNMVNLTSQHPRRHERFLQTT